MSNAAPTIDTIVSPTDPTPSSNPAAAPSATIVPTHFPHKTTSAAPVKAFIDTSQPALNPTPVELDSTPVSSPVSRPGSWKIPTGGSGLKHEILDDKKEPADERKQDPAILDSPPEEPGAAQFEAVIGEDGLETPS